MRPDRALVVIAASLILFVSQAEGQQPVHRVGVLAVTETPENTQDLLEGLRERGYELGRNLQIDYRYSQGRSEQITAFVAECRGWRSHVLWSSSNRSLGSCRRLRG